MPPLEYGVILEFAICHRLGLLELGLELLPGHSFDLLAKIPLLVPLLVPVPLLLAVIIFRIGGWVSL